MVRIVPQEFWANYETYEDVIKRCFSYLYSQKFPSNEPQGLENSFNHLIVEMNRLSIFEKWNPKRPNLEETTLDKKFEQFLYKRIESILSKQYHDRRRRTLRFRRISDINSIHRDTFGAEQKEEIFADDVPSLDIEQLSKRDKEDALKAKAKRHKLYKKYPTVIDIPIMTSEKYETPMDNLVEEDTWKVILASCRDDKERAIVQYKREGLTAEDIGVSLGSSGSNVCAILSQIKKRFEKRAQRSLRSCERESPRL